MSEKRALAVSLIEVGAIAADGDVSTTFESLGNIYKESANLEGAEGEDVEHYFEEFDDPMEIVSSKGETKIDWAVTDFTPSKLVKSLGGSVVGVAPNEKWAEPDTAESIEMSVRVTSKNGIVFTYPRTRLKARVVYPLTKSGIAKVLISCKKMQPKKAGVKACTIG